jgi:outer membrane lipoprotein SlyB
MTGTTPAVRTSTGSDEQSMAVPFLLGAVVGGLAGAVIGAALGRYSSGAVLMIVNAVDRRSLKSKRDRPRFDLLLQ